MGELVSVFVLGVTEKAKRASVRLEITFPGSVRQDSVVRQSSSLSSVSWVDCKNSVQTCGLDRLLRGNLASRKQAGRLMPLEMERPEQLEAPWKEWAAGTLQEQILVSEDMVPWLPHQLPCHC